MMIPPKNKKFVRYGIIISLVAIAAGYFIFKNGNGKEEILTVHPGEFLQQISVSGQVTAAEKLDLSFEQSGRITGIGTRVGEKVSVGAFLASESSGELNAQYAEMTAGIDVQKAKLNQLLAGASPEDIRVAETALRNEKDEALDANSAVFQAKQNFLDTLRDAYTKADDAVRGKADQLFSNPKSANPQLSLHNTIDTKLEADIEWKRFTLETGVFSSWPLALAQTTIESDLPASAVQAKKNLEEVRLFLDSLSLAVNGLTETSTLSQSTIDGWKADVSSARTNVNTALGNLTTTETNLKTKEAALTTAAGSVKTAEDKLALAKAPIRSSDIALYEAQIRQAEASAQAVLEQINKRTLTAPIAGTITAIPGKVGNTASANETVISMISADTLQVESYVPEIHTSFIEIGDEAVIVLDAYGSNTPFDAVVVSVDPAETVRDGVSTYKTTLQFKNRDERIKSGMTANILVTTEKKEGVLSVPQGIIATRDGKKFVKVKEGETITEREVLVGVISSLGLAEIVSGLSDGDVVVLQQAE